MIENRGADPTFEVPARLRFDDSRDVIGNAVRAATCGREERT